VWQNGSTQQITWQWAGDIQNISLAVYDYATSNWLTIVDNHPNNGSYSWTVNHPPTTQAEMYITDFDSWGNPYDVSDAVFEVSGPQAIDNLKADFVRVEYMSNSVPSICFGLTEPSMVNINIFNISGKLVTRLVNQQFESGIHRIPWNNSPANGMYYVRYKSDKTSDILPLVRIK
jgi:hypothetical protein